MTARITRKHYADEQNVQNVQSGGNAFVAVLSLGRARQIRWLLCSQPPRPPPPAQLPRRSAPHHTQVERESWQLPRVSDGVAVGEQKHFARLGSGAHYAATLDYVVAEHGNALACEGSIAGNT